MKQSLEAGTPDPDVINKINEIDQKANQVTSPEEALKERLKVSGVKNGNPENLELEPLNKDYNDFMNDLKKQEIIDNQIATLYNIEDMVKESINDMLAYIDDLKTSHFNEFPETVQEKIEEIETKYRNIV